MAMLAQTPPMGFNTWNTFGPNINEQMMLEITDVMVERGYRDAGYKYVVIDDCWSMRERNENGELVADPEKFPHGMKFIADYAFQGTEVRNVFLRRYPYLCRLPVLL